MQILQKYIKNTYKYLDILSRDIWLNFFLLIGVIILSIVVIYMKNLNVEYMKIIQSKKKNIYNLEVERTQLFLEKSTFLSSNRIQNVAINNLYMYKPHKKSIIIIK